MSLILSPGPSPSPKLWEKGRGGEAGEGLRASLQFLNSAQADSAARKCVPAEEKHEREPRIYHNGWR